MDFEFGFPPQWLSQLGWTMHNLKTPSKFLNQPQQKDDPDVLKSPFEPLNNMAFCPVCWNGCTILLGSNRKGHHNTQAASLTGKSLQERVFSEELEEARGVMLEEEKGTKGMMLEEKKTKLVESNSEEMIDFRLAIL